jgi:hypothetical protein
MTLQAFTNEVGYHSQTAFFEDRTTNHDYDFSSPPNAPRYVDHTHSEYFDCPIAYSNKPPVYKSPGHAPSDYWRFIGQVRSNKPVAQSYKVWNNFGHYWETWREISHHIAPSWHIPFTWDPTNEETHQNVIDESVVKALNKIQSVDFSDPRDTVNFQGGNAFAESRETGRMLAKSAMKLVKVIKAVKGGHWKTVLDTLGISKHVFIPGKTVSEMWLEIQYGWKPLLKDIHDLDSTVRHLLTRSHQIRVEAGAEWKDNRKYSEYLYGYEVATIDRCRTTFLATLTNEHAATLQSLGVINPLGIAWEIVPFSFVVDWFIPVSNTLEALTSTAGFRNDGGWSSSRREYAFEIRQIGPNDVNVLDDPGLYQEVGFGFRRFAYAEWPPMRLYANPKPWSTTHALNALALMSQLHG